MCKIYSENELLVLSFTWVWCWQKKFLRKHYTHTHTHISFQTRRLFHSVLCVFFVAEDNPNSRHYNMVVDETKKKKHKTEIWKKEANGKKPKKNKKEKLSNTINKNIRFRTVSHPIYFIIIYLWRFTTYHETFHISS